MPLLIQTASGPQVASEEERAELLALLGPLPIGPRGEQGERGPQGERGLPGSNGQVEIANDLVTADPQTALGASQGVELKAQLDALAESTSDGLQAAAQATAAAQAAAIAASASAGHTHDMLMTPAERDKLSGVAPNATQNAADSALRDRSTHTGTQAMSTVAGLPAALDGKAAAVHTHLISEIAGLVAALAAKAEVSHTHTQAEVVGLVAALLAKADLVGGKIPTSQLPDSILGALRYQAVWNASTNSPAIPAAAGSNQGWFYIVSVAGATSINGEADWNVGDWIVSNGAVWSKIDNTDKVSSVNGKTGAAVLTAADVGAATAAQGALAGSALQPGALPVGTTLNAAQIANATALGVAWLLLSSQAAQRSALGLGSAAVASTSDFATAAQGVKADNALPKVLPTTVTASRTLVAGDDGGRLQCTAGITLTIPSGLPAGFGCAVFGNVTLAWGALAVTDLRSEGFTNPACVIEPTAVSDTYMIVGGKA